MTSIVRWIGRLHDVRIVSDRPLCGLARSVGDPGAGPAPDLAVRRTRDAPRAPLVAPFYVSEEREENGVPSAVARRLADGDLHLETPDGDFVVGRRQILYRSGPGPETTESCGFRGRLEGPVLAAWLEERRRALVLHGAAIVTGDGGAVAFLGGNGAGKSSLAAVLLAAAPPPALRLVTDDLLVIDVSERRPVALPGPPRLRLDHPSRTRLAGRLISAGAVIPPGAAGAGEDERGKAELSLAPAAATREPVPLVALYLLGRGPVDRLRIEAVPPASRVLELLGRSYAPRLAEAAGWRGRRFEQLARLVEAVPVARLVVPTGLERLPAAARELLTHLAADA